MSNEREQKQPMLPTQLAIAVLSQLIPAVTLPTGAIERALSEPLAIMVASASPTAARAV